MKTIDLDSISVFYHGVPFKNSLKEMNEFYNVCKDESEKQRTCVRLHRQVKLEKYRQYNFHWVINHVGLNNKKKHIIVLEDSGPECSYAMSSKKIKVSLSPVNFGSSVEEFDGSCED
jgi:hypothetical protein